jgi:hypothetical protein
MKASVCRNNPFDESIDFTDTAWPQRMALKYIMGNVPKVLVKFRMHEENIHNVRKREFMRHLTATRFKYFYSLFPNTPLLDYLAFNRIADRQPMTSIWNWKEPDNGWLSFRITPMMNFKKEWLNAGRKHVNVQQNSGKRVKIFLNFMRQR